MTFLLGLLTGFLVLWFTGRMTTLMFVGCAVFVAATAAVVSVVREGRRV